MDFSVLAFPQIQSSSYSQVRLRHIKYIHQLTLQSSASFTADIKHITFKKLTQLKRLSHLQLLKSQKPAPISRHSRKLLQTASQHLKSITNASVVSTRSLNSLKNLKVLKTVHFNIAKNPRNILSLHKLQELSLAYESPPTVESPSSKQLSFFKRLFQLLPNLRKLLCDAPRILKPIQSQPRIKQVLLTIKSHSQAMEFFSLDSLGQINDIITMFSANIQWRKNFSLYLDAIHSMKHLQSLSLAVYADSVKDFNLEALERLQGLTYLNTFHFLITAPLEEYIEFLKLPPSLQNFIFQSRDYPTANNSINGLDISRKAYSTLIDQIIKLKILRILQIEVRPAHDGYHMVLQDALRSLIERMPASIEEFGVVEWYYISRASQTEPGKMCLPFSEVTTGLGRTKLLKKLSLYLNIETINMEKKAYFENLRDLFMTINTEQCKANEILDSLNPDKLKYLTMLNRGADAGWIKEDEFASFMGNLQDFYMLKNIRIAGFYIEGQDDSVLELIADLLVELDMLEMLSLDLTVNFQVKNMGILQRIKQVAMVKKKLEYFKLKLVAPDEAGQKRTIDIGIDRGDCRIELQEI